MELDEARQALSIADTRLDRLVGQLAAAEDEIAQLAVKADAVARADEAGARSLLRLRGIIDARDATIEAMTQQIRSRAREVDDLRRQVEQFVTGRRTPALSDLNGGSVATDGRGRLVDAHPRIGEDEIMLQRAFLDVVRGIASVLSARRKWWWDICPGAFVRRSRNRALRRKGLFDADLYLKRYPDVARAGLDPLHHYILHGLEEGRLRS